MLYVSIERGDHLSKLILAIVTAIRLVLFCHKLEQDYQGETTDTGK